MAKRKSEGRPIEFVKKLDEKFGENWWIRKVSRNSKGEPSLTLGPQLEKINAKVGDKVLVYIENGKIVIQKI